MRITQLNHVAVHVRDENVSVAFYRDVLRLEPIPRPAFDFSGAWFRLGVDQELHLIGRQPPQQTIPRERHTALMVDDMPAWERHLRGLGVPLRGPKPRPDGAMQLFLVDPDGHVIELCTPPAPASAPA